MTFSFTVCLENIFCSVIECLMCTGSLSDPHNCNYSKIHTAKSDLFKYLGLDKNDSENTRMWPMMFTYFPVNIFVDLYVTSIINVVCVQYD